MGTLTRVRFALGTRQPALPPRAARGLAKPSRAMASPGEGEGEARGGRVAGREVPKARLRLRMSGNWTLFSRGPRSGPITSPRAAGRGRRAQRGG